MTRIPDFTNVIPEEVLTLGNKVSKAGGKLYIVGGWVRDFIRTGRPSIHRNDIDLATSLTPGDIKSCAEGIGNPFRLGEKFGTIGIKTGERSLEITTFRSDEYTPGSRHPAVKPVDNIEEDLSRRDFTVNAIAVEITGERGRVVDPFNGIGDIEGKTIVTPGNPAERMAEDPLRMMRAARFASQFDYRIDPVLYETLRNKSSFLDQISWERRRDELEKIIVSNNPYSGIMILVETGLMDYIAPEIAALNGVEQPTSCHRADVLQHTLLAMEYLEPDPLLRRAALFHDVGKPSAKVSQPKIRFPQHDKIGEDLTRKAMKRLKYSNQDIQKTAFLVRWHMRPVYYKEIWSDAAVRRSIRDCTMVKGEEVLVPMRSVLELARADIRAGSFDKVNEFLGAVEEMEKRITVVAVGGEVEKAKSPLDGKELMSEFDRDAGQWIKDVKKYLEELVVNGELNADDKEAARKFARAYIEDKYT